MGSWLVRKLCTKPLAWRLASKKNTPCPHLRCADKPAAQFGAVPSMSVKFQDELPPAPSTTRGERERESIWEREDSRERDADGPAGAPGPPKNIFEAAERGMVGFIVKAVERTLEFNINQRDRLQRTALHWAAECGHVEVVEALLDYGCDARLTECNGRTPFHLATRGLHIPVLEALLQDLTPHEVECLVNQTDMFGITPVFMALQKGEAGRFCFQFLMDHGARYNTSSMPKMTAEELEQYNLKRQPTTADDGADDKA